MSCWWFWLVREELKHKDRADYGKYLIDNLAVDLEIPRRRLYEIVRFYRVYPFVRSVTAQLSWTHYVSLIEIENEHQRTFYENKAILNSWSVAEKTYQRIRKRTHRIDHIVGGGECAG